jgi:hypothetical protein
MGWLNVDGFVDACYGHNSTNQCIRLI